MVARRIPFDHGDSRSDYTDAAVRVQGIGLGVRVFLPDGDGGGDVLLLLPHVVGARLLREGRPPPHPVPGTSRRCPRIRVDVLFCDINSDSDKYWHQYWSHATCRAVPPGTSKNAPPRDYSLEKSNASRVFSAFTSISIIAAIFGNGILPEIQATLAPPATGKMVKGLIMCYTVILLTFYSAAVSGYWVFGNKSSSNIIKSLLPDEGPALAPVWVLGLAIVFILLQLFAIGLVYSQVAYEIMEKKSADAKQGIFSLRNLIPRIIFRSTYVIFCGFIAAMLPFFGDISAIVGAIGFIPLDFVLPMLLYNTTYKPAKSSTAYLINSSIIVVFTSVGLMGTFSSVRKLVLDAKEFKIFSSDVVE